ncbi:MAG: Rid family detoxifying hydrolase, partial [Candidatus Hodarchaeales archaeon]
VGHFVYTSGQLGVDPATGKMKETLGEQTHQVMKNLENVLTAAGCNGLNDTVKTTIFLSVDIAKNFKEVNEIYAHYMGNNKPARSFVQVTNLPLNGLVEIEMVAKV